MWYKNNEYCTYHRKKFHETNKCNKLRNVMQRLIDNGKVSSRNLIAQANKKLGVFQDPLPTHNNNINHISFEDSQKVVHNYNPRHSNEFMGSINIISYYSFMGTIDITSYYEFLGVIDAPQTY